MDLGLKDKVVLVSGGSSGIGKAIALDFARQHAAVLVVARRIEPLQETEPSSWFRRSPPEQLMFPRI